MTLAQRMFVRGRWAFGKGQHCLPGRDVYWRIVGKCGYNAAREWRRGWLQAAAEA